MGNHLVLKNCSRCNSVVDVRVLTDDPYFGICGKCRAKIDKICTDNMYDPKVVPDGTKCDCCKKDISGEYLKPSGFGGYRDPSFTYVCNDCIAESNAEYERQEIETELSGRYWADEL